MKKVLIITYYWPPAGGPGVQRVLKFAKYLPEFGWQPIILTVKNGEYPAIDESLEGEISTTCKVFKTGILEPGLLYKKFVGMQKNDKIPVAVLAEKNGNWKTKISKWIRMNMFIPDAKIGWLPFALHTGIKIIRQEKPDIIFSSSPPPTVHIIAKKLAKKSKIKWVADFRDPWTDIHYYENQNRTKLAKNYDKRLEKSVLNSADKVSCISLMDIEYDFSKKINSEKCINIPNGYDEDDFNKIDFTLRKSEKFVIMHLGAVGFERNPVNIFKSIKKLSEQKIINENNFEFVLIGTVEELVKNSVTDYQIGKYVRFVSYMPHKQALQKLNETCLILLLVTQSQKNIRILPGKTFEYMRARKPIIALGPEEGEVARIINQNKAGVIIDYNDYEKIHNSILNYFKVWQKKGVLEFSSSENIKKYDRRELTGDLIKIFESL